MLTEEEATEKACCGSGERPAANGRCIASECMAWRWAPDETKLTDGTVIKHPLYRVTPIEGAPGHFDNAPLGYCGLAGAPAP